MNPLVGALSLYDVVATPGVGADLGHINTGAPVRARARSVSKVDNFPKSSNMPSEAKSANAQVEAILTLYFQTNGCVSMMGHMLQSCIKMRCRMWVHRAVLHVLVMSAFAKGMSSCGLLSKQRGWRRDSWRARFGCGQKSGFAG